MPHERCIDGGGGCRPFDCSAAAASPCTANAACVAARCRCTPGFRQRGPLCLPVLPPLALASLKNAVTTLSSDVTAAAVTAANDVITNGRATPVNVATSAASVTAGICGKLFWLP